MIGWIQDGVEGRGFWATVRSYLLGIVLVTAATGMLRLAVGRDNASIYLPAVAALIVICQNALPSAARRKAELRQGELIRRYHEVVNTMNAFPVYIGLNSFFKSIVVEHLEKLEDYERSRRYGEAAEIANAIGKRFENIGEGALALL